MFIVASDLSEAQKERLTISLSLQQVDVTAYTFEGVREVFVEMLLYAEKFEWRSLHSE